MTLKGDAKFKEKLTEKKVTSMGHFCPKYMRFELKQYRGVIFHDTEQ